MTVMADTEVRYEEEFITNSRGKQLFTCRWIPLGQEIKALVFMCHGYGVESSVFMRENGFRLARSGYAVYALDYEGHGKSEGKRCYISNFSWIIDDATNFFTGVQEIDEYKHKASFLYGESMGGAVALLVNRRTPTRWNGLVLVAPMCKISEHMKPSPIVVTTLKKLKGLIPTWKIVPGESVLDAAFKDETKRNLIKANQLIYKGQPRVGTAWQLFVTSSDLEQRLDEVTTPFLVLHGEADKVTDPAVSKALYDDAKSFDKTIKLYPGMWHGLTAGESDEDVELVYSDIIDWLNHRSSAGRLNVVAQLDPFAVEINPSGSPINLLKGKFATLAGREAEIKGNHDCRQTVETT